MRFLNLIKNNQITKQIEKQISLKDSMSLLFVSPDSDYLDELTKYICCFVMCKNNVCLKCPECVKVMDETHLDILSYPKNERMSVADVSEIIDESYIKPVTQTRKIIVIRHAEELSIQIQNKLLKTLEEPSKNLIIILQANQKNALLPTVLSRMSVFEIPPFSQSDIEDNIPIKGEEGKLIASISCGQIGKAFKLSEDENYIDLYNTCFDMIVNMKRSPNILRYSEKLAKKDDYFSDILIMLQGFYEDILFAISGKSELIKNTTKITDIENIKHEYSYSTITEIFDKIEKTRIASRNNTNKRGLIDELLFDILEVKYRCHK